MEIIQKQLKFEVLEADIIYNLREIILFRAFFLYTFSIVQVLKINCWMAKRIHMYPKNKNMYAIVKTLSPKVQQKTFVAENNSTTNLGIRKL